MDVMGFSGGRDERGRETTDLVERRPEGNSGENETIARQRQMHRDTDAAVIN